MYKQVKGNQKGDKQRDANALEGTAEQVEHRRKEVLQGAEVATQEVATQEVATQEVLQQHQEKNDGDTAEQNDVDTVEEVEEAEYNTQQHDAQQLLQHDHEDEEVPEDEEEEKDNKVLRAAELYLLQRKQLEVRQDIQDQVHEEEEDDDQWGGEDETFELDYATDPSLEEANKVALTQFNTQQHTAIHCNALQRTAANCKILRHTAAHVYIYTYTYM